MSGRGTSEKPRAPASSSSDSEATRAGSGAILGGALLVGAAAGYALIAFRFKNMHAGTRGSGGAEVGYGAPRAPSCPRSATPAQAPLHPCHCASADASGGDIQQASEPRCEYRLERRGARGGPSRRGGGGRRCMSKGRPAAHRRHLTEPPAAGAPTGFPAETPLPAGCSVRRVQVSQAPS